MISREDLRTEIKILEENRMHVVCNRLDQKVEYAYNIYKDNVCISKYQYSDSNEMSFWMDEPGEYLVSVIVKDEDGNVARRKTDTVYYELNDEQMNGLTQMEREETFISRVGKITKEISDNIVMLFRIARYDYKLENKDAYLGKIWSILTPLIQIGTYWLVFGIGLRSGQPIDGHPFLIWMLCGLVPWFYVNAGITSGANSIYAKAGLVTRMRFPIATVPVSRILVCGFEHIMMLLIMFVLMLFNGYIPRLYYLNVVYYIIYMICFLTSLSLVTSVLTMIARDFQKLLMSLMKLLFYLTPILWDMNRMPEIFQRIMEFSPIYYIIRGFRESLLYGKPFYERWKEMVLFWALNMVLYFVGCNLQAKFKSKFIDLA